MLCFSGARTLVSLWYQGFLGCVHGMYFIGVGEVSRKFRSPKPRKVGVLIPLTHPRKSDSVGIQIHLIPEPGPFYLCFGVRKVW